MKNGKDFNFHKDVEKSSKYQVSVVGVVEK